MRPFESVLFVWVACTCTLTWTGGCDRIAPHSDDHGHNHAQHDDHGAGADHHDDHEPDPVSITIFTSKLELFMEYPHLVVGEKARFLAHLTVLATGEPVRAGTMTVEATGPEGKTVNVQVDAPARDGLFIPELTFGEEGKYRARLVIHSPQAEDTVDVGELVVHPDEHEAIHAAEDAEKDDPPDAVSFLLEQQWKIGTLLEPVSKRSLVHRLQLPGQIVAPNGASAVVSPPVAGRLLRPSSGKLPVIGDRVEMGQVLALIEPPLPATEAVQLSANQAQVQALGMELALRSLDLDTKALEVDRTIIQAKARLEFAQRAIERVNKLREKGVSSERQYDEAEQNLRLAKAEHDGALALKRSYESALQRLGELRATTQPSDPDMNTDSPLRQMPLHAPIAGTVVSVMHIEGEHIDAHQEVFKIVNTDHVWVVAEISEFDLAKIGRTPNAIMSLPAYPGKRIDILGAAGGRLVNIGKVVDPTSRTVSIRYEIPDADGLFRVGMFADVYLETQRATEVVAIPDKAIVLDNGRPTAYVLLDGETFQKRELELGIRDNGFVEVKGGIEAGERIVTKGAYAIKLTSLSPASFGHGHGH